MRVHFSVGVYQVKRPHDERWVALVPATCEVTGKGEARMRERLTDELRRALRQTPPARQDLFQLPTGSELIHVSADVKVSGGRIHGEVPLIVEPRWTGEDRQHLLAYHPLRRDEWFHAADRDELLARAPAFFKAHWAELDNEDVVVEGRGRLVALGFSCEPSSLLDQLPSRKRDDRTAAGAPRAQRVLHSLGIDETRRFAAGAKLGVPRAPYRDRLSYLLGGPRPRSVAVVGPPGSGKTTLIQQWIADRLVADGYPLHRNLERVHHVWRLAGKRLIAGMSYLGQWEERCLSVLEDARRDPVVLWLEDLHLFGRLGQSRQSERSFADFFRGPIRRGDLAVIAELTEEQHAELERDAPGLAEALALVSVPAASAAETAHLLLHEVRTLELEHQVVIDPLAPRTALELGAALFPWRARPGVAIEILRRVADQGATEVTSDEILGYLARTTGLSPQLISLDAPLAAEDVEDAFAARVMGQPAATRAAADVVLKVRAGLADPGRPVATLLFTGPTGTGKTELATAIAEYLYGDQSRLIRIDMGELSGADAVARLIGDRWNPEGLLTSRVRAQPFCVVLLDEIEKAHPQALHLLLQLFDEGRLTDAGGDVASFASAVVIMTSNLGARTAAPIGFGETRDRIMADVARAVREFFPVELFNRIDRVVAFAPLTPEIAAEVVDKELARLLARRGLRERNTFVYAGAAIRRRAVNDAFDPRYGARTVKRWLEDQVGGALTDLLATAPPARLRIVRLTDQDGTLVATLEPMLERPALPGPYLLEGALDLATAALEPVLADAATALARVARALPGLRGRTSSELRYYAEELEQRVAALAQLFGVRLVDYRERTADEQDAIQEDLSAMRRVEDYKGERTIRDRTRRGPRRPIASRDNLVAGIAEALLLERALPELLDPDAHAVTAVISLVGSTRRAGGMTVVIDALAQPAWHDDGAWADADGDIAKLGAGWSLGQSDRELRDAVLVLRGLFVRRALAGEHGTWMIRVGAGEPDMVRVELRPGARPAADVLREHLAARAALERAFERGGPQPPNPDALLPVTRTLSYHVPLRSGDSYAIEIEDFATGWAMRAALRDVETAIRRAWHLAWSRQARDV